MAGDRDDKIPALQKQLGELEPLFKELSDLANPAKHMILHHKKSKKIDGQSEIVVEALGGAIGSFAIGESAIGGTDDRIGVDGEGGIEVISVVRAVFRMWRDHASEFGLTRQ